MHEPRLPEGLQRRPWLYALLVTCVVGLACAKPAAVLAISGYQAFLSPYKGYDCAHAAVHGGFSCSQFGKQAIQEYGLVGGLILLRQRFRACHEAAVAIHRAQGSSEGPRVEECLETDRQRGKREAEEARDYCVGCVEGCFGGG
jgi:putative component of membrane protein insertase Oxa1/YidC/SpoIIIJ protein YidD